MNLKTFRAPTMAQALAQVKSDMGVDAMILHARTFQKNRWLGLIKTEVVEITASEGRKSAARVNKRVAPAADKYNRDIAPRSDSTGLSMALSERLNEARHQSERKQADHQHRNESRPREIAVPGRQLLETPAAQTAVMAGLAQEISSLKVALQDIVVQNRARSCPNIPEEMVGHYLKLIENQVAEDLASEIVRNLQKQMRPEQLAQPELVRQRLAEQLEKLIPPAAPIKRTKTAGAHVVALIGPTGVGKTTTLAKLAANLGLRQHQRVGMITIDTYRIAAVDQLRKYAEIIGTPLKVVSSVEELREAVAGMQDMQYILIDTAGRSPNDTLKLNELKTFIAAADCDEVHLVLSTTAAQDCVDLAISRFADVRIDKILFTKLDEAAHLGVVLNVAHKLNKSLSYVTTGQEVTDDIELGQGNRIAQLILGGAR